ncbi:MAG: carbohydrate ABC transporter permease, partial [Anaerolineae bacterium]|nr:carbohydrate ABC transporter permease [Anaerolineae bacterium]
MNRLKRFFKQLARSLGGLLLVGLVLTFVLAPVLWLVISSISSPKDLLRTPPRWFPQFPSLAYYEQILLGTRQTEATLTAVTIRAFRYALRNSLIVASGVSAVCLALGALAGYAFARTPLPGRGMLIYLLLLGQMIPVIVLIIPLFIVMNRLGLLNRLETVILLLSAYHLPFTIWILRSYFQTLPAELEEAALVDGANRLQALIHIALPLSLPGLFAAGVYTFMQSWNAFIIPLVFTSSDTLRT